VVSRAVVLGGGGNSGFAWQWGVLTGLYDAGFDLADADVVIGTSGGAMAAKQLLSEEHPRKLFDRLGTPSDHPERFATEQNRARFIDELRRLASVSQDATEIRVGLGAMALATPAGPEDESRAAVISYLTSTDWPDRLLVTAVDAITGELVVFRHDSGVPLVDVLAASCAIPGVWDPVTINGRRYVDAILRSPTNLDLAVGTDRVLVLAPFPELRGMPGSGIEDLLPPVRATGEVVVITPDEPSREALRAGLLNWSTVKDAGHTGLTQADAVLDQVRDLWTA
jgi:NTE family protein